MITSEPRAMADALARTARQLAGERGVERALGAMVASAVQSIPGAEFAGVSLLQRPDAIVAEAQSDPLISEIDRLQTDLREGPCLQVMHGDPMVVVHDLPGEERWPRFAAAAGQRGVRSVLSLRLDLERTTGALSLFARSAHAFSRDAEVVGGLFAIHAAIALDGAAREHQLSEALRTRDTIGMAKGIVMAQYRLTEQQAFATLVRLSQTENVKLFDVAARLVDMTSREAASEPQP
jgi:GAF domain-containing protein